MIGENRQDRAVSDQLDVLGILVAHLDGLGIRYMITGSVATSHYATPRMTRDVDVVVELDPHRAGELAVALAGEFYVDESALRRAAQRAGMANAIHMRLLVKIDLIVRKETSYRRAEFERRRQTTVQGTAVWVAAPEDLVLSKLVWMRESESSIQRRDVEELIRSVPELDRDYIAHWAPELGVDDLWREVSHGGG